MPEQHSPTKLGPRRRISVSTIIRFPGAGAPAEPMSAECGLLHSLCCLEPRDEKKMANIHIAKEHSAWVQLTAHFILEAAKNTLDEQDRFVLALSGGSTPRPVYQALPELWKQQALDWRRVHILWSDERCVPLNHPESNYRMAQEALLDEIDIPGDQIHPMLCNQDPARSAVEYEAILREFFPSHDWPRIDLILLGLGTDGHTASLFPDTPALSERSRWVVENESPSLDIARLTLTLPAINAAKSVAFLVAGSGKADVVDKIFSKSGQPPALPAAAIKPTNGELHWLLDGGAAQRINDH